MSNTKSPDSADSTAAEPEGTDQGDLSASRSARPHGDTAVDARGAGSSSGLWSLAVVGAVVLVIDQISKVWAVSALADRHIDLVWTARFNLIRNHGSAFGLGTGLGRWLGMLVVVVIILILRHAAKTTSRPMLWCFGAVVGGAIGNLVDRVARAEDGFMSGGVVDFIDFQWWPIFNVADMGVVCGAIGLLLLNFKEPV